MPMTTGTATNYRHDSPVHEHGEISGATSKVNYVIPAGFNLFIEMWYIALSEGDKFIIELEVSGSHISSIGGGEGKEGGESINLPQHSPYGPFAPGATVTLHREEGTSGKDWSGGFVGYLEEI